MFRKTVFPFAFFFAAVIPASAGVPDPAHSSVTLSNPTFACQWRFQPSGSLDRLTVSFTIHDNQDAACISCPVVVSLAGAGGVPGNFCTCCPAQSVNTDTQGQGVAVFRKIGGGGLLSVNVVAQSVALDPVTIAFTSSDLDGTCSNSSDGITISDEALFALSRNPYGLWGDYNCNGQVNVVDVGLFAGEYGRGCAISACP